MKRFFNKIKISNWPLIFLLIAFSIVFLLFLIAEKYIYTIIIFGIIVFISFRMNISKFPLMLFILSMLTKVIAILIITPPIESDFLTMYQASNLLRVGDLSYTESSYFIKWGYQVGHVVYQAILLNICNSTFFLKIVNCLALSGTTVLIYLIVKDLLNEKVAKFTSLAYVFYLHPVLLTTVLTNQHVPTFLFFLALYLIIKDNIFKTKPVLKYLIAGILIGIGNIMRPEGIVFVLTIIAYLLCVCYKSEKFKNIFLKILVLILSYTIVTKGCSLAFQTFNLSKSGLSNQDPLWKFVLGTNYEKQGRYNEDDLIYSGNREKELEIIKSRTIENPIQFSKLLAIKAKAFWAGNNLYWSNDYLNNEDITIFSKQISGESVNEFLNALNEQLYIVIFILSLIGLFSLIKTKYDKRLDLFVILLSAYFVIYLLIEVMNRYTYTPRVAVFILAGLGVNYLSNKIKSYKNFI